MLYKNLFRLLRTAPRHYIYYRRVSRSFNFMRRYTLLGILYIINAALGGAIKKKIEKIHPLLHKEFVFRTPFGTFASATVNQWTVLVPDYEARIQKVIHEVTEKTPIPERLLVNIGAHVGRYAIELVKNHHYTAYCFEPNPQTFKALKTNTLLSHVEDRCFVFPYALGDQNAELEFEHIEYNDGSSRIIQNQSDIDPKHIIKVPVKLYDELFPKLIPTLIVMDVEGFELHVLRGMAASLDKLGQVDIILEMFATSPHKEELIHFMQEKNFTYVMIDEDNYHFWKI